MPKYAIGLDYGTLSARAVMVNIETGDTIAQSVYTYPHAVMETHLPDGTPLQPNWALQDPQDYLEALVDTIQNVVIKSKVMPEEVVGIGMDVTSATILPVYKDGTPLCMTEKFKSNPHAFAKLWKHHGAEPEAVFIDQVARDRGEEWLDYYGGKVSSEWTIPKILETLRYAPEVYYEADYFLEVMDWLTWQLTGELSASACAMGYKAFYFRGAFPSKDFFKALDPRLENLVEDKFPQTILPIGSRAGGLTASLAEAMHLNPGTPVGTPIIDAHASVPGGGVGKPGEMMIIMGTSSCHLMLSEKDSKIQGIQGIVKDGIMPGYYGVEAGQACVGDHFAWVVDNCMTAEYAADAKDLGMNGHQYLTMKLQGYKAGKSGLLALDWFNGVRSPLMDFDLNGLLIGMNLQTKPEDIYLAMIEATAYGTRVIIENYEKAGVPVFRLTISS